MAATHLLLVISSHSCSHCGNRWTNSDIHLTDSRASFWGGRALPGHFHLPVAAQKHHDTVAVPLCFRCLPITTPDWLDLFRSTTPSRSLVPLPDAPAANLEDLLP